MTNLNNLYSQLFLLKIGILSGTENKLIANMTSDNNNSFCFFFFLLNVVVKFYAKWVNSRIDEMFFLCDAHASIQKNRAYKLLSNTYYLKYWKNELGTYTRTPSVSSLSKHSIFGLTSIQSTVTIISFTTYSNPRLFISIFY